MKFLSPCMKCAFSKELNYNFNSIEMNDSGFYRIVCDQGHETNLFLQDEKFEILFDLGALALIDGYTREAVSSFVASLERFYEFIIQVFLDKNGINHSEFESTWKQVKNQSERQLGAFYFLYLNEFKQAPPVVSQKWIEFRNNVIHKGYIPNYSETYDYGMYLYGFMKQILMKIKEEYSENVINIGFNRQRIAHEKYSPTTPVAVTAISKMFEMVLGDELFNEKTYEKSLEQLKLRPGLYTK